MRVWQLFLLRTIMSLVDMDLVDFCLMALHISVLSLSCPMRSVHQSLLTLQIICTCFLSFSRYTPSRDLQDGGQNVLSCCVWLVHQLITAFLIPSYDHSYAFLWHGYHNGGWGGKDMAAAVYTDDDIMDHGELDCSNSLQASKWNQNRYLSPLGYIIIIICKPGFFLFFMVFGR